MSVEEMKIVVPSKLDHDEGKLSRLFEGPCVTFPGNGSLIQYFQAMLADSKKIDSSKVALVEDEIHHTFHQLDETSSLMAEAIRVIVKDGTRNYNPDGDLVIGVCIPPSDKLVLTLFAVMKLGAAYLPYDVSFPEDRVNKITRDASPLLIISDHHSNVLSKFDVVKEFTKVYTVDSVMRLGYDLMADIEEEELKRTSPLFSQVPLPERTAIVLYTSGSSGEPKGVRLNHRAIMNRLHWQWQTFPFQEGENCVLKTSLTFVDSVAEIFGPLLQGFPLIIFPKANVVNPSIFIQKLDQFKITRLVLVPSLLRAMFNTIKLVGEEARKMLECVKLWVCSGETLTKDLVMEFFDYFPVGFTICNFYGSTEIMGDVTYVSFANKSDVYYKSLEKHIPIGQPINNTVIYILNPSLDMCPQEEHGEIYVGGYNLATGYVGMGEDPRFIANPFCKTEGFNRLYKTGDFGRITETPGKVRTIAYEGRVDSQIKVRGQRVDLSEVEMVLSEIHLIKKVKVLCYHPGGEDQAIVAFLVPAPGVHLDRIKALVDANLREYERPVLRMIEDIPLLVNGKTDRQRLLKMYEQEIENKSVFADWNTLDVPEENLEVAKVVITAMSEVTGTSIEEIVENLNNSYFNVGGSSLNSIETIVKLRERNCFISIADFLGSATIREIIEKAAVPQTGEEEEEGLSVSDKASEKYSVQYLADSDKSDVCHIIAHSFAHHGDLEKYTDSTYQDFVRLITSIWEPLVQKELSFIIRRKENLDPVAVALNFDVYDEPTEIDACPGITYVLEMLEFIESRQREKLPKGKGKLVHSFMMGTSEKIDDSENVFVIQYMEEHVIRMADEKRFFGIMTTNTNPLTQQIGLQIHGYEVLATYQVNHYVAPDGNRPFLLAPDDFKIVCCWKRLAKQLLEHENKFFRGELSPSHILKTPESSPGTTAVQGEGQGPDENENEEEGNEEEEEGKEGEEGDEEEGEDEEETNANATATMTPTEAKTSLKTQSQYDEYGGEE